MDLSFSSIAAKASSFDKLKCSVAWTLSTVPFLFYNIHKTVFREKVEEVIGYCFRKNR